MWPISVVLFRGIEFATLMGWKASIYNARAIRVHNHSSSWRAEEGCGSSLRFLKQGSTLNAPDRAEWSPQSPTKGP